jgi:hypothetical protein
MRYLLGLTIGVASLVSITALIFAEPEWFIEPGASYTIDDVSVSRQVSKEAKVKSAGKDPESAELHCKTEGAIRLLEDRYKNYSCKACVDGSRPFKTFHINYPSETLVTDVIEHKIGGITVYIANCNVAQVSGTLYCSNCPELLE